MKGNFKDLTGQKFGRLTVIKRVGSDKFRQALWLCKCDCGNKKNICGSNLRSGVTKSCGCLRKETSRKNISLVRHSGGRKLPFGLSSLRGLIKAYKYRAKKRGYTWDLTKEQFIELTKQDCYYCGSKPNQIFRNRVGNGDYIYNGIDRIDNSKGYTVDNSIPCCGFCNMAKKEHTEQEFKDWVKKVYNKMFSTN